MILIDSNVFVIDLRYPRDLHAETNRRFLDVVRGRGDGATTLFNLLEVAGILSYNLNPRQLRELITHFPKHYGIRVLPELRLNAALPSVPLPDLLAIIEQKTSFGDALILHALQAHALHDGLFVSWDARHFEGKAPQRVLTPEGFLAGS